MSDMVLDFAEYQGDLIASGWFYYAGGRYIYVVARWDGQTWQPLGPGLLYGNPPPCQGSECTATVEALQVYEGSLIAGGRFTTTGDRQQSLQYIARWDGTTWHPLGAGMNDQVWDLEIFNGELVATGRFTMAGGRPANYIARWNGQEWQPLDYGLGSPGSHLQTYGDKLIVSGWFSSAGIVQAFGLAAWDGSTWSSLGTWGALGPVQGFDVPRLGLFGDELITTIYRAPPPDQGPLLALWNGSSWRRFSDHPIPPIIGASTMYNGQFVVTGLFYTDWGGGPTNYIARWNGETWLPFGSGLNSHGLALIVHQGHLYVGGRFTLAGGKPSEYIARWDDVITPVELEDFAAAWEGDGVRLTWRLSRSVEQEASGVFVQRAEAEPGPYMDRTRTPLEPRTSMTFVDSLVSPGRPYWYRLRLTRFDGEEEILRPIGITIPNIERSARLRLPIVPADGRPIEFRFEITGQAMAVQLDLFDVRGRLVRSLDQGMRAPGTHVVLWNRDPGARVARGVYVARLRSSGIQDSRKFVVSTR